MVLAWEEKKNNHEPFVFSTRVVSFLKLVILLMDRALTHAKTEGSLIHRAAHKEI